MSVRRLSAVGVAAALSLCFAVADEPSETGAIPNWTAPPYWTPPLAREVAAWKEQGLLPEGAEAVEGLPSSALPFFAIVPCRIVDTRPTSGFPGAYGPPAMAANAERNFDLNSAAHCPGIPANAEAYSINVTVTETTGLGDVRIWPAGSPPAVFVSTQNWPTAGLSIANAAIVPSGTGGAITVYVAGSATHLIIDINGYYAPISIVNTINGISGAVTLAAGSNVSITPSGQTLTIAATAPAAWSLTGNAGTTPGTHFLGTTDDQALELKVNSQRVMRFELSQSTSPPTPNVIGGNNGNTVTAGVYAATIFGGAFVPNLVTDSGGTVGGGSNNRAGDNAGTTTDRLAATVGGGSSNTAGGAFSTVPGGQNSNASGAYSFAAGRRAKANHDGAFVWGDGSDADVASSATNQFVARATGGFRFHPSATVTCSLTDDTGWQCVGISDRNLKREIAPVDVRETLEKLLAVPIRMWSYSNQKAQVRHMGPMAQDFAAAYALGADDKTINPVDANGVALAAIQGLYELVKERDSEIEALKARLSTLESKRE